MKFIATADTDVGIVKDRNQDSLLIKHAKSSKGEVLLAIICDGMGGLAKGELASATVVREFSCWFEEELPFELENLDMHVIGGKWSLMLKDLNIRILEHGQNNKISMGTTFTGILIVDNHYVIVHVGDTRVYYIGKSLEQLTNDQTFIAREISRGSMTLEQSKTDKRRNMLLQCIGSSEKIEPEIIVGDCEKGTYMICSDGFRHEITENELYESLNPINFVNKKAMHAKANYLIEQIKKRQEKDNISVILIKAY